jgi:cold shock CspA family protein
MECLASNFDSVLKHFEENLQGALYAAVDMELTGIHIDNMPDSYKDTAEERLHKMCDIAERHAPIQIGITLVKHDNGCFHCSSYNFYAKPWVGPELLGKERSFLCRSSALQFNVDNNHIDFNKWLKHGVPYMTREDEARYLASPQSRGDTDLPRKVGLLRVWKLLCEARVPLVTHCPLDMFFLLSCFEQQRLPRNPAALAKLILKCLPCIFDTAHLHGAVGGFRNLKLVKFLEEAQARHTKLVSAESALHCYFSLEHETALQYGAEESLAHEAGFDSLCTAQLFAHLLNISPKIVYDNANCLFLYKSTECIDLANAAESGEVGSAISSDFLLVGKLHKSRESGALKSISDGGLLYKWIDSSHLLVSISSQDESSSASASTALASQTSEVQWLPFAQWRSEIRLGTSSSPRASAFDHLACRLEERSKESLTGSVITMKPREWLDGGSSVRQSHRELQDNALYHGLIKSCNLAGGYSFISCHETRAIFGRDVFVHSSEIAKIANPHVGQEVIFSISTNDRGQPQAKDLSAVDSQQWISGASAVVEIDADEVTTTVGATSDGASTSDLESVKDGSFTHCDSPQALTSLAWLGGELAA